MRVSSAASAATASTPGAEMDSSSVLGLSGSGSAAVVVPNPRNEKKPPPVDADDVG